MTVDSWQPTPVTNDINPDQFAKLLDLASEFQPGQNFTPESNWIQPIARIEGAIWQNTVQDLSENQLIQLIKLLTSLETQENWDLADKSPVIAIFKVYKKKAGVNRELVQWVKANSDNKYLPFGPLL